MLSINVRLKGACSIMGRLEQKDRNLSNGVAISLWPLRLRRGKREGHFCSSNVCERNTRSSRDVSRELFLVFLRVYPYEDAIGLGGA
jgi:hypothetical protein